MSSHNRQPELGINNDNGNTELPTIGLGNSDSNDTFVGGGTLLGEVSLLPNKFLSAKNSIEIHKNKVLTSNQSMPNVIQDRNHCLNNLISQNQCHSSLQPFLKSFLSPSSKPERSSDHDHDYHLKHASGQKSTKTVNWAPVLSGQNKEKELIQADNMASPQTSSTNIHMALGSPVPENTGPAERLVGVSDKENVTPTLAPVMSPREDNYTKPADEDDGKRSDYEEGCKVKMHQLQNGDDSSHHNGHTENEKDKETFQARDNMQPFVLYNHSGNNKRPSQTQSDEDIQLKTLNRQDDLSTASVPDNDAPRVGEDFPPNSPSFYKRLFYHRVPLPGPDDDNQSINDIDDGLPLPLLTNPTDTPQQQQQQQPHELELGKEYAGTDIHNGTNKYREISLGNQKLTQNNSPVRIRDQSTGSDMTTLTTNDNNLENHNYDTDDDIGEPNLQTPVLTMVNPNDLPAPDADYVARMVPAELHPFIARRCKKDCRTWLWKSKSQRESYLARQKLEQEKEREKQHSGQ